MDKLETIMTMQRDLQKRLGTDFSNMTLEERANFMRNHRGYLEDEVAEALYEMPMYKTWKDYSKMTDEEIHIAWQKVRMELIDSLHFFVNLLLCAGMSANEVCEMYVAKNLENHRRQDEGYTADKSYREQPVEDVMKPTCTIVMDGETTTTHDFVVIMPGENGEPVLMYNTTVPFFAKATALAENVYDDLIGSLPDEGKQAVLDALEEELRDE